MILKASTRSGAGRLALHLLNEEDNDHVDIHELRGFVADDLKGALQEINAISKGTRCEEYMFSLSLSPPAGELVNIDIFENSIEKIEKKLGLGGQPRAVVFHEKEGRRHAHCVWSRIDAEKMKAIELPYWKEKLNSLSKEFYLENGWKLPEGHIDRSRSNPVNFGLAEWQQAKRQGEDPRVIRAVLQEAWITSDNVGSFSSALEDRGFTLAAGDRRSMVAVDYLGEVYSLTKNLGIKTKELVAKLGNPKHFPSVREAKEKLSGKMKKMIENIQRDVRNDIAKQAEPILAERLALRERHRSERERMEEYHLKRETMEMKNRAAKLPKGLAGIWHRLTGKYQAIRNENERSKAIAVARDRAEKQMVIETQLNERRALQLRWQELRDVHKSTLSTLREDTAYYLRLNGLNRAPQHRSLRESELMPNSRDRQVDKGNDIGRS